MVGRLDSPADSVQHLPDERCAMSITQRKKLDNLIQVKQALSEKYARRAEQAGSQTLRARLQRKSRRYRRQAEQFQIARERAG